ncbi:DUF5103 domain-containing protein [Riemerella columbina]|uniref:type IX secretion system plug protein n=1 Tax=Riemerella columbina TaxID=103810 RepID=UPI00266EBA00|nr:DUF5103 domain-containing protein [Riemerella columbina]WKS94990.1 DUF5103 domain-containing protein [Riemerella columbina]
MKYLILLLTLLGQWVGAQNIKSIQLFNPQTNDETPVINLGEQLVLSFDDLANQSTTYHYTLKHYDRNWQDDGLFFTEYAQGNLNALLNQYRYSFNTLQPYTHYELTFPNDKIQPKISGNFEIIVYKNKPSEPLFTRRFCVVENAAQLALNITRFSDARNPELNQRVEVKAIGGSTLSNNVNNISLNLIQNNNWNLGKYDLKPSNTAGGQLLFQQLDMVFPGNNEFYYFDNKNIDQAFDMVAQAETVDNTHHTYLYPVWAYPMNYQYQPDVNGAFFFRRNDLGIERVAATEGDYSWVHFYLDSAPMEENIYILGLFNQYTSSPQSQMYYNTETKQYEAKIYLKQGFYNYILATQKGDQPLNYGQINGNFWQTENLYQAFLYYRPFGKNYDGLLGYGEYRNSRP